VIADAVTPIRGVIAAVGGPIPLVGGQGALACGCCIPEASSSGRLASCGQDALVGGFASIDVRSTSSNSAVVPLPRSEGPVVIGRDSLVGRRIPMLTGVVALDGSRVPIRVGFPALAGRFRAVPIGFVPLLRRRVSVGTGRADVGQVHAGHLPRAHGPTRIRAGQL
jgi:hypothetical protein